MHNAYALVRVENWFSNHRSYQLAISWNVNSLLFLSGLPDASGKSLLRKLGFGYMLSPMVAYTSCIIMQAIPARVIKSCSTHRSECILVLVIKIRVLNLLGCWDRTNLSLWGAYLTPTVAYFMNSISSWSTAYALRQVIPLAGEMEHLLCITSHVLYYKGFDDKPL